MEKILALIEKRREKKSKRLILNAEFWRKACAFGSAFVMSMGDRELSKGEFDHLSELWGDLAFTVRNARERTDNRDA